MGLATQPLPFQYWPVLLFLTLTLTPWICIPGCRPKLASTISSVSVPLATLTAERFWPA